MIELKIAAYDLRVTWKSVTNKCVHLNAFSLLFLQVSIIAGRPMHCQVPGIDYSLSKLAIHAALESATAIALSHTGTLYIAETDEKKINRVRQVGHGWFALFLHFLQDGFFFSTLYIYPCSF